MKEKKIFGYEYTNNEYIKIIMYLFVGGSAALFEWAMFYLFFTGFTELSLFRLQTETVLVSTTLAFGVSTM